MEAIISSIFYDGLEQLKKYAFLTSIVEQRLERKNKFRSKAKQTTQGDTTMEVSEKHTQLIKTSIGLIREFNDYSAAKMFESIRSLEEDAASLAANEDKTLDETLAIAIIHLNIGVLCMRDSKPDKQAMSEKYFKSCTDLLYVHGRNPKVVLISLTAFVAWYIVSRNKKNNLNNCNRDLKNALKVYIEYTKSGNYPEPVDIVSSICPEGKETSKTSSEQSYLDRLHIATIKGLEFVNNSESDLSEAENMHSFKAYIHVVLKEEVEHKAKFSPSEYANWLLATFYLIKYLINHSRFSDAKHNLIAATYMLETKYKNLKISSQDQIRERNEALKKIESERVKAWIQYGLMLMRLSVEKIRMDTLLDKSEANKSFVELSKEIPQKYSQSGYRFPSLKKELEPHTIPVPDKYVTNYDEGYSVLKKAEEFEITENEALDYNEKGLLKLKMSRMYGYLSFFESRNDVKKTSELRVNLLKNCIDKIEKLAKSIKDHIWLQMAVITVHRLDIYDEDMKYKNEKIGEKEIGVMKGLSYEASKYFKIVFRSLTGA